MQSFVKKAAATPHSILASMTVCLICWLLCSISLQASALDLPSLGWFAKAEPIEVNVNDAYIDVYDAPGEGFPIFHVVERGETITLLKMRTDWIKIKTARGLLGWIKRKDVLATLGPDQQKPEFLDATQADYLSDRVELGAAFGDFDGATAFDMNLGYRFTQSLSTEIRFAQNTGQYSNSKFFGLAILHQPFPAWRVSPYIGLAAGNITTTPNTTLVRTEDRKDDVLQTNLGAYIHLTGRFFIRAEVSNDYILTSRNSNQEVNEWKLGFNVFF